MDSRLGIERTGEEREADEAVEALPPIEGTLYRTKTGKVLTEEDLDELVREAEAGYELSWYVVEHFGKDDSIKQRKPLRTYVVQAFSHANALAHVPEHPPEWSSKITNAEFIPLRTKRYA